EHRHAERLQHLEGCRDIEQRFDARRNDDRPCPCQLDEIGRDVRPLGESPMNASDAAGSDELDPDPSADRERPADRRRPEPAARPPTVPPPTPPRTRAPASPRGPTLRASAPAAANRSSSLAESPTRIWPSTTPIVAGTALAWRTARSASIATSSPAPSGNPCATSVVSRPTIGAASP